jgi:hypothetical protein
MSCKAWPSSQYWVRLAALWRPLVHRARSPTEESAVSWRLLLIPPLCATLAPVSIRRGDSGTARQTIRAPFRRRQNALIWTIKLVNAPTARPYISAAVCAFS